MENSGAQLNVVIVGGSLSGLMHGVAIKHLGHNVHILEQSLSDIRDGQAAGITAGPFVQSFLKKHDHSKLPWSLACPGLQLVDQTLNIREFRKIPFQMTSWDVLYYRLRANFDGFVSDFSRLPPPRSETDGEAKYDVGKCVLDISSSSDGLVKLDIKDLFSGKDESLFADIVIAADGAQSTIRRLVTPNFQRPYAGYFAWRGTVEESVVSEESKKFFAERTTLFFMDKSYIILYTIPGRSGSLVPGQRVLNFVWYCNCPSDPQEFANIMTDCNGHQHHHTLPAGRMQEEVWAKQRSFGMKVLPPPFAELVRNITQPFVTAISDTITPQASFFNGKVLLVGDALALFRPNIAQSTNQAAFDCLAVEELLTGRISLKEWEQRVMDFAHVTRLQSITWGTYYLSSFFSYMISEARYRLALVARYFSRL